MPTSKANDWPLQNGDTVCIVGGGPGGASCALAIKREAEKSGKEIRVLVFEQKRFKEGRQFNQCIGVLSPPPGGHPARSTGIGIAGIDAPEKN